ncbi:flagellar biosynthesis anti-sigma factor protein FlgM [Syntrophobotulus glycolicus DSM 8271]|uniref:Negative regulator of flagellin synthesis n=1 Tax=Syntrophobotulus glycolicus (strain DSM 8271 / FlGlyR) TaxID=645991 RepID=F0SZD4_SYNGF|nr:flagellar biosynthesis anti-sigma factor FlgM [Syntrophobotulus glycolicus]ADY54939.1 flagellar biosynthesis anti-sigma factor protein FlgM [Syntrophobotulus glycolicus DSM 8271]
MKIDPLSAIKPVRSIRPTDRDSGIGDNGQASQSDKIAVSGNAQVFQNLLQKAKVLPEIREEKVNQIKTQIENGKFDLDGVSLAESLLSPEKMEEN